MGSLATHNSSSHRSHSRLIAVRHPAGRGRAGDDHKKSGVSQDKFKPPQLPPPSDSARARGRSSSVLSEGVKLFKIGTEINCRDNLASPHFAAERE